MRKKKSSFLSVLVVLILVCFLSPAAASDDKQPSRSDASCTKCHEEYTKLPNILAGKLVDVAAKSKTIQLQIDKDMEIVYFDDATTLKNAPSLKEIPKQESIKIEFVKKDGKNLATAITVKKGIEVAKDKLATVEEIAELVAKGPDKGKYVLLDSRPETLYNEGHIPTAVVMPFSAFDKMIDILPKEKDVLQIYYCAGFS